MRRAAHRGSRTVRPAPRTVMPSPPTVAKPCWLRIPRTAADAAWDARPRTARVRASAALVAWSFADPAIAISMATRKTAVKAGRRAAVTSTRNSRRPCPEFKAPARSACPFGSAEILSSGRRRQCQRGGDSTAQLDARRRSGSKPAASERAPPVRRNRTPAPKRDTAAHASSNSATTTAPLNSCDCLPSNNLSCAKDTRALNKRPHDPRRLYLVVRPCPSGPA